MNDQTMPYSHGEVCEHGKLKRQCDDCWNKWEIRRLQDIIALLRAEAKAARTLSDASPLAFKYCKQQWLDAVQATNAAGALENK